MIPDETVREIRERASILEVVSDYVSLKKSGVNYLGLCPFHTEKTPSFNVNPAKGIFHCFGCGVGGDAVNFIMRMESISFPEALRFLARRVGVTIPEKPLTASEKRRVDERETFYGLYELAVGHYRKLLTEDAVGEPARGYLKSRGVSNDISGVYGLGFAPESWDSLARYLERNKVSLEDVEKVGLVRKRERGGYYDVFRNRLLFPISDIHGRPIGFGGRVLDASLPKYLNSPESAIYRKSDILFGLSMAKQAIREKGEAFVVEGYFDHLALFSNGIRNVVATCGTALTGNHVKLLRRFAKKALLLFDADSAGKKATFRAMEIFLEEGFPASVVQMPAGEDPDTYLAKYGVDAFIELVSGARPVIDYFLRDLCRLNDISTVDGKMAVLEELAPRLAKIPDSVERDLYAREVGRLLQVEENLVRRKLSRSSFKPAELPSQRESCQRNAGPEEMLLALMAKYPEVADQIAMFGPEVIFRPELLPVVERIVAGHREGSGVDWAVILDTVESSEERSRLMSLLIDEDHLEQMDVAKAFEQCKKAIERVSLREMKTLTVRLAQTEPDSDEHIWILNRLDFLRTRKSQLT
jgi:DNA primase